MVTHDQIILDRPLVLATRNEGKISEFKGLFSEFKVELKSLRDFGPMPEVEEDGKTFEENAYKKSPFYRPSSGVSGHSR